MENVIDFVQAWLPDYERRFEWWRCEDIRSRTQAGFCNLGLPEALGAYAKAQREECQDLLNDMWEMADDDSKVADFEIIYRNDALLDAPAPPIFKDK